MSAFIMILFKINLIFAEQVPWDRWILDNATPEPRVPRRHAFGKADSIPHEAPNFNCECPPNEECKLDFEIDDVALDFLKLNGLLKKHVEAQLKNHMLVGKKKTIRKHMYNRRSNDGLTQQQCCCPPNSHITW